MTPQKNLDKKKKMELVFQPNKENESVHLNNVKVAAEIRDFLMASYAVSNWMDSDLNLTLKDIELELRRLNIPLWLQSQPKPEARFYVARSMTSTPDDRLTHMCAFTVGTQEYADSLAQENNLEMLLVSGFLSLSPRKPDFKPATSLKQQEVFDMIQGKVKLSLVHLDKELQKDIAPYTKDQIEMKVVSMTHEGGPILIPFVGQVPVSDIGTAIEYNKSGEKVMFFVRMQKKK
jgi:hypothetical protein